jgi:hypothetical protein
MHKKHAFQLTIIDRDLACAPSHKLQLACAKMVRATGSPRVLLASTFETMHSIERSTEDEQKATSLMEEAAIGTFHTRSATDECHRRTDSPVDWVEECVARFIEEYIGVPRREWPAYAKKKQKRFDILCIASSAVWRDAIARISVRSGYFVRSFVILAPVYTKENTIHAIKATLSAKLIDAIIRQPAAVTMTDQQPFVCERIRAQA